MLRIVFLLTFLATGQCWAQRFGFGIKGGVRLTGDIDSYFATSESRRYAIGPMVDIGLPLGFGVEVDALYRRTGFRTGNGGFWGSFQDDYRANTWEFPLLLKYRLGLPLVKPYVEAGYSLRHIAGSYTGSGYNVDIPTGAQVPFTTHGEWNPDVSHGIVTGGGVEFGAPHLHIAPEVRYTRWNNDPINFSGTQGSYVSASRDQVEALVGITWR